jgi:hypothetical protein
VMAIGGDHAIHEAEKKNGMICYLENLMTMTCLPGCRSRSRIVEVIHEPNNTNPYE